MTRLLAAAIVAAVAFIAGGFVQMWIGPTEDEVRDAFGEGCLSGYESGRRSGLIAARRFIEEAIRDDTRFPAGRALRAIQKELNP